MRAMTIIAPLLLLCGCESTPQATPKTSAPAAAASAAVLVKTGPSAPAKAEDDPPFHSNPVGPEHAKKKDPPPASPKRQGEANKTTVDDLEIIVSNLSLPAGEEQTATIELRPTGQWTLNVEYPMRVTLGGLAFAVTPKLKLRTSDPAPNGFQRTSGGARIDIPISGDAPGEDKVTADIRVGVCTPEICEARKVQTSFLVTVQPP